MELIQFMKQKVAMKDDGMNVNNSELRQLIKLKEEGYLQKYRITESYSDGTHDVTFFVTEKFKEL
ncbi:hypothetical protein QP449_02105 [Staphylococcus hominis]|uniref:hypothetical protein n=1 Tax=Staphylococcus hominis TaxID=1290 RepID=UPI0011A2C0D2|nr:hypothetical protein [Staphylococcus hominis]MBU5605609.1 hypothetical protein [Staphylococcus hominis]MDK7200984.1 hypothetical protein [Staphylococcus hominis]